MESGKTGYHGVLPAVTVPDRPCDIPGIPEKFAQWRPHQREAVQWILESIRRPGTVILNSPVGSGKSLSAIAVAKLCRMKVTYLCPTLQLQEQVTADFPDAVAIWGRANFDCKRFRGLTAADCTHETGAPCPQIHQCDYLQQKRAALQADVAVLNTSYALHEMNYVAQFSGGPASDRRALLVIDEADCMDGELLNFVSLVITAQQLERCKIEPPKLRTKVESWLEWTKPALVAVAGELRKLDNQRSVFLDAEKAPPRQLMRDYLAYSRLHAKLQSFVKNVDDKWIAELDKPDQWEFKPVWVSKFGNLVTAHADRILAMSGTISATVWAGQLGIDPKTISYRQVPSTFPAKNRPIVYLPVADFSRKSMTDDGMQAMVRTIDSLIDNHADQKGLIQAVSYNTARYIMEHSRHRDRLMTHNGSGDRTSALDSFVASPGPKVLVSPSFIRGVDLRDDLARYQCLCKLPFADLSDKQTQRRRWSGKAGERWYLLETVYNIVQMAGRIVRGPEDWGTTYILDARWERFFEQNKGDFPSWFVEAVQ